MSDTRTIYLKNNEGTIYSSDPSTTGYEYLNISDFDSLNPSDNSIFTLSRNTSLLYSSYDVKLVLTFMSDYDNGRQARADWVAKNQNSINQISVANTNNQDLIFSKQAKIKTIDFVENPYVNGVQAELTLELAGRWQSSVKRTRAIVYPYTSGTKKYTYHYSTLDRSLLVNRNYILNSQRALTGSGDFIDEWWVNTSMPVRSFSDRKIVISVQVDYDNVTSVSGMKRVGLEITANQKMTDGTTAVKYYGTWKSVSVGDSFHGRIYSTFDFSNVNLENQDTSQPSLWGGGLYIQGVTGTNVSVSNPKIETGNAATDWTQAPEDTNPKPAYKYGYQVITDEVVTEGYNGFIINIPSQTTPVNVTLTAPSGLSATLKTSQMNVPLQISSDMIGYSLDNFNTFTLLNKGFPASKYWDNLLSVYSTIQTILSTNTVTVSVTSGTGTSIPFEFYLYKLQDLI